MCVVEAVLLPAADMSFTVVVESTFISASLHVWSPRQSRVRAGLWGAKQCEVRLVCGDATPNR